MAAIKETGTRAGRYASNLPRSLAVPPANRILEAIVIRTWAVFVLTAGLALPALAIQRVTVEQLENVLSKAQGAPDTDYAAQLSELQLSERFSQTRVEHWQARMPGPRSQRALLGLADRSAFLAPPSTEIPRLPAPDLTEQRRMMGIVATYVGNTIPQLPRFYAARTTTHFEDSPGTAHGTALDESDSLHAVRIAHANVLYRDGEEIVEPGRVKAQKSPTGDQGLRSWGAFGPILGLVLVDAAENTLSWDRWEQGSAGPVATYRYAVPKDKSHYEVRYCCVAEAYGLESQPFQEMSAYHGQISVDPATGVIVRLTVEAELKLDDPISRAATAVEYGPVELGGKTYMCPVRSVSISVARTLRNLQDPSGHSWVAMGPRQMMLNHVEFEKYHLFRAEARVLSGAEERAAGGAPDATLPKVTDTDMVPDDVELSDAPARKPAEAAGGDLTANTSASSADGEAPEISTGEATGLPDIPANQAGPEPSGLTLRINARLVDVNVVALDKKGRPITNLKPGDFEVYDNGVKQELRSFAQTEADAPAAPPAPPPSAGPAPAEFSNHSAAGSANGTENNTIVLLVDGSNLSFGDLVDARQQMVRFLQALPAGERVALYSMNYHGYKVLQEATTEHAPLAAMLAKWMPTAQDMANGQDEEQRNRQQFETVHSPEDLLNVNGNYTMDNGAQTVALDPKMRELGSRPVPNALDLLISVAHHLSAMPGHKNLVWVTSDNALADWNKLSFNLDKGSRNIEPAALRAQEAMNKAHASVYPLDASRLEVNVVNADIGRNNVVLTPTFQTNPIQDELMQATEVQAGQDINVRGGERDFGRAGHLDAQAQQDMHSIQGVFREVADATGGRTFRRSSNIIGELDAVVADAHATYLLGFSPSMAADGQYHRLTVKLIGHRDATLRFRSGYLYDKEPNSLKQRFAQTVWDPVDATEIGISSKLVTDAVGSALRVTVAGSDLNLTKQNAIWTGKVDIFLVRRDQETLHAKVSGLTVGLRLKGETYQKAMKEGLTFDERLDARQGNGSLRVVVVDVNSGRIGSVTVPTSALLAQR
jgi:VWFA-related protein